MNQQGQRSGSSEGQQSGQQGSGGQQSGGPFFPVWQSNADMGKRREMIQHIVRLLNTNNASQDFLNKLPEITKQLEVSLYRNAPSFAAYADTTTLKDRLRQLATEFARKTSEAKVRDGGSSRGGGGRSNSRGSNQSPFVEGLYPQQGGGQSGPPRGSPPTDEFAHRKKVRRIDMYEKKVQRGREVMRTVTRDVVSFIEAEPLQVPLEYLRKCTDNFSDCRKIGEGTYSCVYAGKDRNIRRRFAVKRLRLKFAQVNDDDLERARNTFQREVATLKHFRHRNIARMYAYNISSDLRGDHCLVYEMASNGSLFDALKNRDKIHWTTRVSIALDVSKALEYLHKGRSGQICYHRDIKSANVCLRRDYTAVLVDCGISKMVPIGTGDMTLTMMDSTTGNGARGTPGYMCPDFSRRMGRYSSANDVFSLGVVLAEIFTGLLQNCTASDGADVDMFNRYSPEIIGRRDLVLDADKNAGTWDESVCKELAGLVVGCLSVSPGKRPSIEEIVQQLGGLASKARPRSPGERNHITALTSAPLVWQDADGVGVFPLPDPPNLALERDLLTDCIKESRRDIRLTFDTATDDRLQAAATRRCGCLHFSGHGSPDGLLFEDGKGGAHWISPEKLHDCVHEEPFKFVFVSACYSLLMGEALVKAGVRHVVCCELDKELQDAAALKFTHTFYYALAEGYTVKDAFEKGKMSVDMRFEEEAKKYVLLPKDGEHNVHLFDAELLEWHDDEPNSEKIIPLVPEDFVGRKVDVYKLLNILVDHRLVNLVGKEGIGCSALAAAVSSYIRDRRTSIICIESIYYLRRKENDDSLWSASFLKQLYNMLAKEGKLPPLQAGNDDESALTGPIIEALDGTKALIVFDGVEIVNSSVLNFISSLVETCATPRILIISRSPQDVPLDFAKTFELGPLGTEDAAVLFGKVCPHAKTFDEQNSLSAKIIEIGATLPLYQKVLEGMPRDIIRLANSVSGEQYLHLLDQPSM